MAPIDKLIPELGLMLLESLGPADLHAAIQASPTLFRIFADKKHSVLWKLAQTLILPGAMKDAIGVVSCPRPDEGDFILQEAKTKQGRNQCGWLLKYEGFMDRHFTKDYGTPGHIDTIVSLFRLHWKTNGLIRDYFSSIRDYKPSYSKRFGQARLYVHKNLKARALSMTELTRLQRAFFRYETICRLYSMPWAAFQRDDGGRDSKIMEMMHAPEHFLCKFPDWEIEEIHCVLHYVQQHYHHVLALMCDAMLKVLHAPIWVGHGMFLDAPTWVERGMRPSGDPKGSHGCYVAHLSGLGLGNLLEWKARSDGERLDFVKSTLLAVPWFMTIEFFDPGVLREVPTEERSADDSQVSQSSTTAPNASWVSHLSRSNSVGLLTRFEIIRLRHNGWVFWDGKRLSAFRHSWSWEMAIDFMPDPGSIDTVLDIFLRPADREEWDLFCEAGGIKRMSREERVNKMAEMLASADRLRIEA